MTEEKKIEPLMMKQYGLLVGFNQFLTSVSLSFCSFYL